MLHVWLHDTAALQEHPHLQPGHPQHVHDRRAAAVYNGARTPHAIRKLVGSQLPL